LVQHPPLTFLILKIVEVTDLNMDREKITWQTIWKRISEHLINVGCFPVESIARFALDSLLQLAGKFLAKEELKTFKYQRDFLKPFHTILRKSHSSSIRLHALQCLTFTVHRYHVRMKSGLFAVFNTLKSAATFADLNRLAVTCLLYKLGICQECSVHSRNLYNHDNIG
jgi:Sec7-like guanine-nucleotide exchange factor